MNKELIKTRIKQFYELHGRYPLSEDFTKENALPSARYMQRNHNGIVAFKREMNLPKNQQDARLENRLISANNQSKIKKLFVSALGEIAVHEQSPYADHGMMRSDFKLFLKNGTQIFVDLFHPSKKSTVAGCLNVKLKKFQKANIESNIYFVCTNESLLDEMERVKKVKGDKIPHNIKVVSLQSLLSVL